MCCKDLGIRKSSKTQFLSFGSTFSESKNIPLWKDAQI